MIEEIIDAAKESGTLIVSGLVWLGRNMLDLMGISSVATDKVLQSESLTLIASYQDGTVPYVADFPGRQGDLSHPQLQTPTPRPFYCSTVPDPNGHYIDSTTGEMKNNGEFLEHAWFFFKLPNQITLPWSRIYVDPYWQWTSGNN